MFFRRNVVHDLKPLKKCRFTILLLITVLLVLLVMFPIMSVGVTVTTSGREVVQDKLTDFSLITNYSSHPPIIINGEGELRLFAVKGNGTEQNPYVIEGYNITSSQSHLIVLKNTTSYVIIQNNWLNDKSSRYYGIHLSRVKNVIIEHNIISGGLLGIIMDDCSQIVIQQNRIYNITLSAVMGANISSSTVIENSVTRTFRGFSFVRSHDLTVSRNNMSLVSYYSIEIDISSNVTIFANDIVNNTGGVEITWSEGVIVRNNNIKGNARYGVAVSSSQRINISRNVIAYNNRHGVHFDEKTGNSTVIHNDFVSNSIASLKIQLYHAQAFDDGQHNTFERNYWDDFRAIDADADSYYDIPYLIDGNANNTDQNPLMFPCNGIKTDFTTKKPVRMPIIIHGPWLTDVIISIFLMVLSIKAAHEFRKEKLQSRSKS